MKSKKIKYILLGISSLLLAFFVFTGIRAVNFKNYTSARELDLQQTSDLLNYISKNYDSYNKILKPLPYQLEQQNLNVWANASILVDTANGNILYEKNADKVIPPASMTKLFAMYVVDEEVSAGNLSYDQIIPLPKESWACNMPPHSSLMFLGEGQRVTLEELLLGLSICSGNDAAYALAYTISGSMEGFVDRMNQVAFDLGLVNTHFVESSGYSELNTTTPREMAAFCCVYLQQHPDSLQRFHAVQKFTYPKKENLAPGDVLQNQNFANGIPSHITMPITQQNTNPLLGKLDGVDGLKTGYIDESGYNLALTARRFGTRFLSVTMEGPGNNSKEGQAGRVHDGTELMEWAFKNFKDYPIELYNHSYFMRTFCASEKGINLVPAWPDKVLTVPYITGDDLEENLKNIHVVLDIYDDKWGAVELGQQCGVVRITLQDFVLLEIPLLADRQLKKGNFLMAMSDKLIRLIANN